MQSSNIKYLPAIDHLRGYAALLIIFYHGLHLFSYNIRFNKPFGFDQWLQTENPFVGFLIEGHTAVALFMVLSGFIFVYGVYGKSISAKNFLINRWLRTYPLFLFIILIGICVYPQHVALLPLLKTLFGLANMYDSLYLGAFSAMFWAISVEWAFYIVFPLLLLVINRSVFLVVILIALFIGLRFFLQAEGFGVRDIAYKTIMGRMDQFLIGMCAAVFLKRFAHRVKYAPILFLLSLITLVISMFVFHKLGGWPTENTFKIFWPTYEGIIWAWFIISYILIAERIPEKIAKLISKVGMISYSMYLIHFCVITFFIKQGWYINYPESLVGTALLNSLLVLPGIILLSFISYRLIEKPFLDRRIHYIKDS